MLYNSAPSGPPKDVAMLTAYKKSVGLKDAGHLYGPGTGKSLVIRGVIPPTPWDWPASGTAAYKKEYRDNLLYMGNVKDKARKAEWLAAAAKVV
jgi:hypothetical protein